MALVDQKTLKRNLDQLDEREKDFYGVLNALCMRLTKLKVGGDAEVKRYIDLIHKDWFELHNVCYRKTVDACETEALVRVTETGLIGRMLLKKAKRRVDY